MTCDCCDRLEMPDEPLSENIYGDFLCAECHIWSHHEIQYLAFKGGLRLNRSGNERIQAYWFQTLRMLG